MNRIAVVTATRAEFGLLTPLIRRISEDEDLELDLIVTGTHLSEKYGHTVDEIYKSGYLVEYEIPILDNDNSPYGISITMANAVKRFAECFRQDRPDMVVILGDRTEMLGVAAVAMNECIPIAHIHGGEVTEGAVDDCVRHAITKMSYLHFTCTDIYRNRVIQMGEHPDRVYNVGSLGTENILIQKLYEREELKKNIFQLKNVSTPYAVVTFHPVTLEVNSVETQIEQLCIAMDVCNDIFFLITASNADAGGLRANKMLQEYCDSHANANFVDNLGMKKYLSAVKHAIFVLGNSSSGILEAPALGTPTVNIGNRQKGRLRAETVIDCDTDSESIIETIKKAEKMEHKPSYIFGDGHASEKIVQIIKKSLGQNVDLKKGFYDLNKHEIIKIKPLSWEGYDLEFGIDEVFDYPLLKNAVEKYITIMHFTKSKKLSDLDERAYSSFYLLNMRNETWRKHYFDILKNRFSDINSDIKDIVEELSLNGNNKRVEISYASKMLATIDPNKPIIDRCVRDVLGINDITGKDYYERKEDALKKYSMVESFYKNDKYKNFREKCVRSFDDRFSNIKGATEISVTKKVDFVLWAMGKMKMMLVLDR